MKSYTSKHNTGSNGVKRSILEIIGTTVCSVLFFSTSVFASEDELTVAAVSEASINVSTRNVVEQDDEIGSTEIVEFDSRLGAYSREDGSMMGAYGDGEYDE